MSSVKFHGKYFLLEEKIKNIKRVKSVSVSLLLPSSTAEAPFQCFKTCSALLAPIELLDSCGRRGKG